MDSTTADNDSGIDEMGKVETTTDLQPPKQIMGLQPESMPGVPEPSGDDAEKPKSRPASSTSHKFKSTEKSARSRPASVLENNEHDGVEKDTDQEKTISDKPLAHIRQLRIEKQTLVVNGIKQTKNSDVDICFIEPLAKKYECPICIRVLRYPVQFEDCGHRCCSSCLPELLKIAPRCPIDQSIVERDKVIVDKSITKEIEALGVRCANNKIGCKWKGVLKEFFSHHEDCKYQQISCPRKCGVEFEKRFLDKHIKDDCPKRDTVCEFCSLTISVDEEISHLNECSRFPIPCPNGCKKKEVPREELDDHMENSCTRQGIPCPFSDCGCDHRCARKEMNKHIRDEPVKHLTFVGQTILAHKKALEMHSDIMDEQNERLEKSLLRIDGLEKLYGSQLVWKIDTYSTKVEEAKAGKKPTIFSPPFLTSRHGYKMAMSCCLYGDGKARGKFMSIFVCICRGEFDALLLWPFCHRVTFTLVDQCQDPEARKNVTYSVKPNTCKENKAFLGRPSGDRNASFGAQKFCELGVLETLDYIRDDTLFIKVNIEMDDMALL